MNPLELYSRLQHAAERGPTADRSLLFVLKELLSVFSWQYGEVWISQNGATPPRLCAVQGHPPESPEPQQPPASCRTDAKEVHVNPQENMDGGATAWISVGNGPNRVCLIRADAEEYSTTFAEEVDLCRECMEILARFLKYQQTEREMNRIYNQMNTLLDTAPILFVILDRNLVIQDIRGRSERDAHRMLRVIGGPLEDLFPGCSSLAEAAFNGEESDCEILLNQYREYYQLVFTPLSLSGKDGDTILVAASNITKQKQAQVKLKLINNISRHIADASSLEQALQCALEELCRAFGVCYGEAWMPNGQKSLRKTRLFYSSLDEAGSEIRTDPSQDESAGSDLPAKIEAAWKNGSLEWFRADDEDAPFAHPCMAPFHHEGGCTHGLCLPLIVEQKVVAVLVFYIREPATSQCLETMIGTVANELGLCLAHQESRKRETQTRRRLQALSVRLVQTEDRERRRLARSVHDAIGHSLSLARIRLAQAREKMPKDSDTKILGEVEEHVVQALQQSRSLTQQLSPPILHQAGFLPAVEQLCTTIQSEHDSLKIQVDSASRSLEFPERERVIAFSAVKELLMNAIKHAEATHILVDLEATETGCSIRVQDDGSGFRTDVQSPDTEAPSSFGLFSIRQQMQFLRGRFDIESTPGRGTSVRLYFPFPTSPE